MKLRHAAAPGDVPLLAVAPQPALDAEELLRTHAFGVLVVDQLEQTTTVLLDPVRSKLCRNVVHDDGAVRLLHAAREKGNTGLSCVSVKGKLDAHTDTSWR